MRSRAPALRYYSAKKPFEGILNDVALINVIQNGQLPGSINEHEERSTFFPVHILYRCWSREPSSRPQTKEFVEVIQCALFDREESNHLLATRLGHTICVMTPDGINIGALKNVSFDKGDFEIDDPNDMIRTFSLYGRAQYAYMEGHESASSAFREASKNVSAMALDRLDSKNSSNTSHITMARDLWLQYAPKFRFSSSTESPAVNGCDVC